MNALIAFLTNKKTGFLSALSALMLLFFDASFVAVLHDLGVSDVVTAKLVTAAKAGTIVLAGLGWSPVKKPDPTDPPAP